MRLMRLHVIKLKKKMMTAQTTYSACFLWFQMAAGVTLFSQDKLAFASLRDKCLEYKTSECGLVRIALDVNVQWNTV